MRGFGGRMDLFPNKTQSGGDNNKAGPFGFIQFCDRNTCGGGFIYQMLICVEM